MNQFFSPDVLNEIRRSISRSLADTFQMMFQIDILLLPQLIKEENPEVVHAYIEMSYQEMQAILLIAISRQIIEQIADNLEPGVTPHSDAILRDVVREVTNIVANHLRSYVYDKMAVEFVLGLPQSGLPPQIANGVHAVGLHFRIKEHYTLDLDFSFVVPPTPAKA